MRPIMLVFLSLLLLSASAGASRIDLSISTSSVENNRLSLSYDDSNHDGVLHSAELIEVLLFDEDFGAPLLFDIWAINNLSWLIDYSTFNLLVDIEAEGSLFISSSPKQLEVYISPITQTFLVLFIWDLDTGSFILGDEPSTRDDIQATVHSSVLEPSALALMGLGLLSFGATRHKQKKN